MTICIFIISTALLLMMQSRYSKEICCWIYHYTFYVFLYSFIPFVYVNYSLNIVSVKLPNLNTYIAEALVLFSTLTNLSLFAILLFVGSRRRKLLLIPPEIRIGSYLPNLLFFCIIPFSLIATYLYPWAEFGTERTLGHSIASYLKTLSLFLFVLQSASVRYRRKSTFLYIFSILLMVVLFVFDTARTGFLVTLIAVFYAFRLTLFDIYKFFPFVVIVFLAFLYVTLARTGIEFRLAYLLWPFFAEGIFGSYSALSAIAISKHFGFSIANAMFYFVDQLLLITPNFLIDLVGYEFHFEKVLKMSNSLGIVDGRLSPLGGFFSFADMILSFSYFGSIIFPVLIVLYIRLIGSFRLIGVYSYLSFFVLVKSPIYVLCNSLILISVFALAYRIIFTYSPKRRL